MNFRKILYIVFILLTILIACIISLLFARFNKDMKPCIFCDIINKERPADILLENQDFLLFKDIKVNFKLDY